ncbi:MAG TPA: peptidase [bacterium]|nr:peptidase [bacterium]
MTYCVGIHVNDGLVFASDSRTNAGLDHISSYSKLHCYRFPGDRMFVLLAAGNLATTQEVVKLMHQSGADGLPTLSTVPNMHAAVDFVAQLSATVQRQQQARDTANTNFEATFIFGGQILGQNPELYMIYAQGNFIHEPPAHPFLQIGETKYGKPILDRVIQPETDLETAARCALVSINSTIRSNLSVGAPIELLILQRDMVDSPYRIKLNEDDSYYRDLTEKWGSGLQRALEELPRIPWQPNEVPEIQLPLPQVASEQMCAMQQTMGGFNGFNQSS